MFGFTTLSAGMYISFYLFFICKGHDTRRVVIVLIIEVP